ncbi:MAG: antibiotic biosynthesis monooxygenase [Clostridia bacterium]|nr:antibiotic biosynthesis monooxygenase [Clostridia bacterium]
MTGLNVYYYIKEGMMHKFIDALDKNNIAEQCRDENGCLQYDYFISKDCPKTVLLLIERWENADAQKVHTLQPHFLLLQDLKAKYVEKTEFFNYSDCK